eukprot:gnl/TRDRNA2_/TRDRNA2_167684_c0_seq2.p2 gnl/TRDRNA2_/TRDRNA2_167684_c0~~gnl/TRDRNA2_/TRDRNA2_167684_c0_seq2.p2  ORF type:complete len:212 (-),score=51.09 gnl/TRDRNA2_/TRDRNA2_167684_c0_seq2:139-774(-)
MIYVMGEYDKYFILKYQPSQRFSRLRAIQKTQKNEVQKKGQKYDETEHKPLPEANMMCDLLDSDQLHDMLHRHKHLPDGHPDRSHTGSLDGAIKGNLSNTDIFAMFIKHEQRLNRIDALDEHNLGKTSSDKMAQFLRLWEMKYWRDILGEEGARQLIFAIHQADGVIPVEHKGLASLDTGTSTYKKLNTMELNMIEEDEMAQGGEQSTSRG